MHPVIMQNPLTKTIKLIIENVTVSLKRKCSRRVANYNLGQKARG
jgi:hypothetical protein